MKAIKADWTGDPAAQALIDAVAFEWGFDLDTPFTRDPINPHRQRRVQLRPVRKQTAQALQDFKDARAALVVPDPELPPVVAPPAEEIPIVVEDPAPGVDPVIEEQPADAPLPQE